MPRNSYLLKALYMWVYLDGLCRMALHRETAIGYNVTEMHAASMREVLNSAVCAHEPTQPIVRYTRKTNPNPTNTPHTPPNVTLQGGVVLPAAGR